MAESSEQDWSELDDFLEETNASDDGEIQDVENLRQGNEKKRLRKELISAEKRGVCYLSRVPPRMDPTKLRQLLSKYGEIQPIYLVPEDPRAQLRRKQAGGFRGKGFSEGWVEFTKKTVAKRAANILNGEQIVSDKRTKEQRRAMEISAATRECDFYLKKVDQSRAFKAIQERRKKKQKTIMEEPKVIRRFTQNKAVTDSSVQSKPRVSRDVLLGVFGGSL